MWLAWVIALNELTIKYADHRITLNYRLNITYVAICTAITN